MHEYLDLDLLVNPPWKADNGCHVLDVIPYTVGVNDPNFSEGEKSFVFQFDIHHNADGEAILCRQTYNKRCPICDFIDFISEKQIFPLLSFLKCSKKKKRCLYNVHILDSAKEEQKGIQIFEVAEWFMQRNLVPFLDAPDAPVLHDRKPTLSEVKWYIKNLLAFKRKKFIPFFDTTKGASVAFTKVSDGKCSQFHSFRLINKGRKVDDNILDQTVCLDSLLKIPTFFDSYTFLYDKILEKSSQE